MAGRRKQPIDYTKLNFEGTTEGLPVKTEMEETQSLDLVPGLDGQMLNPGSLSTDLDTEAMNRLLDGDDSEFTENLQPSEDGGEEPDTGNMAAEGDNVAKPDHVLKPLPVPEVPAEEDLGLDDVWEARQAEFNAAKEKRQRLKRRLQREKLLAEEKLQEEKDRKELAELHSQIKKIDKERKDVREARKEASIPGTMHITAKKPGYGEPTGQGARPKAHQHIPLHTPHLRDNLENDGESVHSCKSVASSRTQDSDSTKKDKKKKSGFLDKPRSNVVVKMKWPHMNQNPRYVTTALTFNQLNFCQFVGGECRTILRTSDGDELYGRLRVLSKIAYLFDQCKSWDKARAAYFAILSSIEEGEASWTSTFGHYDLMCPYTPHADNDTKSDSKSINSRTTRSGTQIKKDFFCKEFQKGDCTQQSPHKAWVKNGYETVEHFCVPCFKAKMGKLQHIPNSDECSQKK